MYNPYDLLNIMINGKPIYARPIEFDSDVTNQDKMTNSFGNLVKPSKLSTMCPDCAQGLIISVELGDPPFDINVWCEYCNPAPAKLADPFVNPISSGRVDVNDLNPSGFVIGQNLPETNLSEVFTKPLPLPSSELKIDDQPKTNIKPKPQKKTKEKVEKPVLVDDMILTKTDGRLVKPENSIGFDDSDMLED